MSEHPRIFGLSGLASVGVAVLWWLAVFGPIVARGYGDYAAASRCIWSNGYTCALLLSLCDASHPLVPKYYRPELFWAGAALLLAALGLGAWRRVRAAPATHPRIGDRHD